MKYLSNINRIRNCWNLFGKEYAVSNIFLCHFFLSGQQRKITKLPTRENFWNYERKLRTHEMPTRKNFGSTKYPREKIWVPRNNQEKIFWIHEIPMSHGSTMALDSRDPRWHATHKIQHTPCAAMPLKSFKETMWNQLPLLWPWEKC